MHNEFNDVLQSRTLAIPAFPLAIPAFPSAIPENAPAIPVPSYLSTENLSRRKGEMDFPPAIPIAPLAIPV